jgi:hypothetical protein
MSENQNDQAKDSKELELNLRFVKLTNGDDILCQVPDGFDTAMNLIVAHPIRVVELMNSFDKESSYAFMPWMPFTDQDVVAINKLTVISITTVKESIQILYLKHLTAYLTHGEPEMEVMDGSEEEAVDFAVDKKWVN